MVLTMKILRWHRTIIDGIGQKLTRNLVHRKSWVKEFLKGWSLDLFHLNDFSSLSEFTDVCNFADDTTFKACDIDLNFFIKRLEHDSLEIITWN